MGTRGTIIIHDGMISPHNILVTMYKQYDSYVSGLGVDLFKLLKGRELVNGFSGNMTLDTNFNGMGEVAAYVVTRLKQQAMIDHDYVKVNGKLRRKVISRKAMGNVYITRPLRGKDSLKEFNYHIYEIAGQLTILCEDYQGRVLFNQPLKDLSVSKLKKIEKTYNQIIGEDYE